MTRKKSSALTDLWELTELLPWWGALVLAVVVYAVLGLIFPALVGNSVVGKAFAQLSSMLAPWFAGFVLVAGAFTYLKKKSRNEVLDAQTDIKSVRSLTWQQFEELIGTYLQREGYTVEFLGGAGPDGCKDAVAHGAGNKLLVQCKHWKAHQVGVAVVREVYGAMIDGGFNGATIATSGIFTPEAIAFTKDKQIHLINGKELMALLGSVKTTPTKPVSNNECNQCGASLTDKVRDYCVAHADKFGGALLCFNCQKKPRKA